MLTLLTVLLATAHADDLAYATCCDEAGAYACPTTLTVVGPGTTVNGADAAGLWKLTCSDGASFFPHAERQGIDTRPGVVLDAFDATGLACFEAACPIPSDLCLDLDGTGTVRAYACGTSQVADARAFGSAPRHRTAVVASAGRVVRTERLTLESAQARTMGSMPVRTDAVVAVRRAPATTSSTWAPSPAPPAPAEAPVWSPGPSAPSAPSAWQPEPAKPAPVAPAPTPRPLDTGYTKIPARTALLLRETPAGTPPPAVDWSIPAAPPTPCVPNPSLRAPSADQVDRGDEAIVAGDLQAALGHYRAALGVDKCNGYAWSAMGALLLDAGYASRAQESLSHSARLLPGNVLTWVRLGAAEELLGNKAAAIEAYHHAIELRPGYLPAEEALRRVVREP